jgi:hypothetical protein
MFSISVVVNLEENFAELDKNALNFVATEVSASLTFAKLAQDTRDFAKRERNLGKATRGYQTALYFLRRAMERHDTVSPHTIEGLKMLRFMLRQMGELIPE